MFEVGQRDVVGITNTTQYLVTPRLYSWLTSSDGGDPEAKPYC